MRRSTLARLPAALLLLGSLTALVASMAWSSAHLAENKIRAYFATWSEQGKIPRDNEWSVVRDIALRKSTALLRGADAGFDLGLLYEWDAWQKRLSRRHYAAAMQSVGAYYRQALTARPLWGSAWAGFGYASLSDPENTHFGETAIARGLLLSATDSAARQRMIMTLLSSRTLGESRQIALLNSLHRRLADPDALDEELRKAASALGISPMRYTSALSGS